MKRKLLILALMLAPLISSFDAVALGVEVEHLSQSAATIRLQQPKQKFLLIPVEEKAPESAVSVISDNQLVEKFKVRLAKDKVDYFVPYDLTRFAATGVTFDIEKAVTSGRTHWESHIRLSNEYDTINREQWRPAFHHAPTYGWMNDPNGMFYLDGTWHLYYQYGPFGSMWNNMHWRHSTSTDLIHWKDEGIAIAPDAFGTIFSGSCVVDKENTAGFGKGAIIALYTTEGISQRQCLAYSTDNGKTFKKYVHNPILAADIPDFRDPNMFWNEDIKAWNLILASGQEMRIYSSPNLIDWTEESRFGLGYGNHDGVWECPDLIKIDNKWVLICNINPGGPYGGSATQYFVGSFDGHEFKCEDKPYITKWLDYGKDHYATVSFSNAPDNRHVVMAWMSNWEYANIVPTKQFRSANTIARDLFTYEVKGNTYVGARPSKEYDGGVLNKVAEHADTTINVKGSCKWALSNKLGEKVTIEYDEAAMTLSFTRTQLDVTSFSSSFPAVTVAPVHRKLTTLRVIVDNSSVEIFGNNGEVCLTNLVFPTSPLTTLKIDKTKKPTKI